MNELLPIAGIITALSLGTMSPGPSFVVVARTAVAKSRSNGVATAFGMGVGGVVFASAALLGLQSLLIAVPMLYVALKIAGGLYLCYLGIRIILSAGDAIEMDLRLRSHNDEQARSFLLGLATQISNPKTAIVYTSVFAAFLPSGFSPQLGFMVLCSVFLIETGWYSIVAIMLSAPKPRRTYLNYKKWIDRLAGLAMGALGIRLLITARSAEL